MVKIRVQYLTTTIDFEWNKEPLQETIESLFSKFNFHGSSSDYILRNEASPSKAALTDQVLFISKILIYRCKFANFIIIIQAYCDDLPRESYSASKFRTFQIRIFNLRLVPC